MLGYLKTFTKRIAAPDQSAPQLLGPDRAPAVVNALTTPNMRFYDPNSLMFQCVTLPTVPGGPGGGQNYNSDCARQPQVNWNRAADGCATMEFFRRVLKTTGLEHV